VPPSDTVLSVLDPSGRAGRCPTMPCLSSPTIPMVRPSPATSSSGLQTLWTPCGPWWTLVWTLAVCRLSVRFQGGPPSRPRRRHGALAFAPAGAPATAGPTPVGWRENMKAGPLDAQQVPSVQVGVPAPAAGFSETGQDLSSPSVTAGQPHPRGCLVNVHAKTTLTETCPAKEMAAIGSRDTSGQAKQTCPGVHAQALDLDH
jgi:hypothetical protein